MKRISGTEYLATRDVGMRAEAESVATATLFIAMNPGGLEVMDLTDSGLFERIRILPYPELPPDRPKDRDLAMNVISEPAIRQAMLALLVRYAVANRWPPDDIPSVAQAREVARNDALGDAGDWIRSYVVKGRPMGSGYDQRCVGRCLGRRRRRRRRRRHHGFWSETDRLYQAGWPVDRRRVRKIPLDGQPVCPWLGGLEDVDSRGSVDRPGRSKLLRSLRKAL